MIDTTIENKEHELLDKINTLNLDLDKANIEAKNNWDLFIRCKAEIENIKKRTDKDIQTYSAFALQNILTDLLPLIDSFELCIKNMKNESEIEGVNLIYRMLINTLEKYNLKKINILENEKLDSLKHEVVSVSYTENDIDDDTVTSILQNGYILNDRVIRYAKVSIIKRKN